MSSGVGLVYLLPSIYLHPTPRHERLISVSCGVFNIGHAICTSKRLWPLGSCVSAVGWIAACGSERFRTGRRDEGAHNLRQRHSIHLKGGIR
jgi:hypothetical protein